MTTIDQRALLLPDRDTARRRVDAALRAYRLAKRHERALDGLRGEHGTSQRPGVDQLLVDRAHDVEAALREALAAGVTSLNELDALIDAPTMEKAIGQVRAHQDGDSPIEHLITKVESIAPEMKEVGAELRKVVSDGRVAIVSDQRRAALRFEVPGAGHREIPLQLASASAGRVGADDFLSVLSAGLGANAVAALVDPTGGLDVYGLLLGGFAAGREAAYRHAREVAATGTGGFRGGVAAAAVIALIALIAAIVAAVTIAIVVTVVCFENGGGVLACLGEGFLALLLGAILIVWPVGAVTYKNLPSGGSALTFAPDGGSTVTLATDP